MDGETIGYQREGNLLRELPRLGVAKQVRHIGVVFQQFNLFQHMSALENVMLAPLRVEGLNKIDAKARALKLLSRVGLDDHVTNAPSPPPAGSNSVLPSPAHWPWNRN